MNSQLKTVKMRQLILTVILLISVQNVSFSQTTNLSSNIAEDNEILSKYLGGQYSNTSSNIEGSPFLNEDFQNGMILFDGRALSTQLRYNVVREEMQVLFKKNEYSLKEGMDVNIGDKFYQKFEYKRDGKNYQGYFEVLSMAKDDSILLLRKDFKKIRPGQAAGAMRPAKSPKYVDHSNFYLKVGNSKPFEIHGRRKKFLKSLPEEYQEEVKNFMKENKLSARNQEDLLKVVDYLNSF